jgi:Tfp pilus assembly protein PilN
MELLGQLPADVADALVAFTPLGPDAGGTAVLAAVTRREEVASRAACLDAAGLAPARIDLAPLPVWNLVPAHEADVAVLIADRAASALSLRSAGRLAGLRALAALPADATAFAAEVRWSLAALGGNPASVLLAGADATPELMETLARALGLPVRPLSAVAALDGDPSGTCAVAAGLVAGGGRRSRVGLAFAGGDGASHGSLRRSAVLAGLALFLGLADLAIVRHGLLARDAMLTRAIAAEAAAALPGVSLVAPREQLAAAAETAARREGRLGGPTHVLEVLRELSARIPPSLALDLDELAVEPDGIALHGRVASFDAVDVLRRALAGSPLFRDVVAEETRTTVDGRRVEFRLRAARGAGGEVRS